MYIVLTYVFVNFISQTRYSHLSIYDFNIVISKNNKRFYKMYKCFLT